MEARTNWALKLANLRNLRKSIESYLETELGLDILPLEHIDFTQIAFKSSKTEIVKLIELALFTVVNCPDKDVFIRKIMELDEDVQTCLMHIIKKTLGEDSTSSRVSALEEVKQLELKLKASTEEISSLKEANSDLKKLNEDLNLTVTDLQKQVKALLESQAVCYENSALKENLEHQIKEKEALVTSLRAQLYEVTKKHEQQVSAMFDELDLANSKINKLVHNEKTIVQYRKKLEKSAADRQKLKQLAKENEEIRGLMQKQAMDLGQLVIVKSNYQKIRGELQQEKDKNESLLYAAQNKDKQMQTLQKQVEDLQIRLEFEKNKTKDLEQELLCNGCDSPASEESAYIIPRRPNRSMSFMHSETQLQKETQLLARLAKKKEHISRLKETVNMVLEEYSLKIHELSLSATNSKNQATALDSQLQEMANTIANRQTEKMAGEQVLYELEEAKASKEKYLDEVKQLYKEKDEMYRKYIELKDASIEIKNEILSKEVELRQSQLNCNIYQEKLAAYEARETANNAKAGTDNCGKCSDLEREVFSLKHEVQSLLRRVEDKDKRIEEIQTEKNNALGQLENKLKEKNERTKAKYKRKLNATVVQTKEAIESLQYEKAQLANRLKTERKYTEMRNKANIDQHIPELETLREEIKKKDKDIEYLTVANKELKHVWKDTASMLKTVLRQLGDETRRIEEASRGY